MESIYAGVKDSIGNPIGSIYDVDFACIKVPVSSIQRVTCLNLSSKEQWEFRDKRVKGFVAVTEPNPLMILIAPIDVVRLRTELKKAGCIYLPKDSIDIDGPPKKSARKSLLVTGSRQITGADLANYMTAAEIDYCYIYQYGAKCIFDERRLFLYDGKSDFKGDSTAIKFLEGFIGLSDAEDNTFDIGVSIRTGGIPFLCRPRGLNLKNDHGIKLDITDLKAADGIPEIFSDSTQRRIGRMTGEITPANDMYDPIKFKGYPTVIHVVKGIFHKAMDIPQTYGGAAAFNDHLQDIFDAISNETDLELFQWLRLEFTVCASSIWQAIERVRDYLRIDFWIGSSERKCELYILPVSTWISRMNEVMKWAGEVKLFSGRSSSVIPLGVKKIMAEILEYFAYAIHSTKQLSTLTKFKSPQEVISIWVRTIGGR